MGNALCGIHEKVGTVGMCHVGQLANGIHCAQHVADVAYAEQACAGREEFLHLLYLQGSPFVNGSNAQNDALTIA